jgi:hypothetical protein
MTEYRLISKDMNEYGDGEKTVEIPDHAIAVSILRHNIVEWLEPVSNSASRTNPEDDES